jgi:phosphoglycolate phosphatase
MMPRLVMFDLDGTLVDSRAGIEHSLRMTLKECGVDLEAEHDLSWCIGSSLWEIFGRYLETDDQHRIEGAVARYRHIYRDGPMFEYTMYDGVVDMLDTLQRDGSRLVVATAKAHEYAREVIATAPFSRFISHVYGSELDGTNVQKKDLIRHVLREEHVGADQAVMVGDRHHDIHGAIANGVAAIAAAYGYGSADEHVRATAIIRSPRELVPAIVDLHVESR